MSLGRRKSRLDDASAWVFNRVVAEYAARPAYPTALIDALEELAVRARAPRVLDLGAGIGHVALPLLERGLEVIAVEPALGMLEALRARAARAPGLTTLHAQAEALPLPSGSVDLVVIADAVHFLDKELVALEVSRVLAKDGALAMVVSELDDTPFMRGVRTIMEESAPRRPREVKGAITQIGTVSRIKLGERHFHDQTPVDPATLERILGSISFIGPAMNPERTERFRARIHAVPGPPVWARHFTLHSGRRRPRA